jgi:hypothetical protein
MSLLKFKAIIFSVTAFLFVSCNGQSSVEGNWKIKYYKFFDQMNKKDISFDLEDEESIIRAISKASVTKMNKKQVDSLVTTFRKSYLNLKSDSSFYMDNNGLIIPNVIPGFHFVGALTGKWTINEKKHVLSLKPAKVDELVIKYKLLKVERNVLVIEQFNDENEKPFSEVTLVRQ